jgi:hypothetical protein
MRLDKKKSISPCSTWDKSTRHHRGFLHRRTEARAECFVDARSKLKQNVNPRAPRHFVDGRGQEAKKSCHLPASSAEVRTPPPPAARFLWLCFDIDLVFVYQ